MRLFTVACLVAVLSALATTVTRAQCVGDANGDGTVQINELVTAVDNSLSGCDVQEITLQFAARVGDEPFACGQQYTGLGTGGTSFIPADLRLYISEIELIDSEQRRVPLSLVQDGLWQHEDTVLLDFEDKTPPCSLGTTQTNSVVRGMAPRRAYQGIRFVLGIPFRFNHLNSATAPAPFDVSAMFWSWQGGRKFIRIDEATDLFRVHLGSTQCASRVPTAPPSVPCGRPNRGEILLSEFDPATQTIVVDMAALFADSDLESNQPETPPGCMSNAEDLDCGPLFANLGINFDNGLPDQSRQTFFRVE
jgi:uncharacterized repeat protein (TIGR04052 family)